MKKPLRCAVIGVGNMGQHHARVYAEMGVLHAVCDRNVDRVAEIARLYDVPAYTSVKELLKHEPLDAVSVAVPSISHRSVAEKTLQAKIPTLVEKPLATTVADAQFLINLAQQQHVTMMVGHIERFNPVVQALKKLIDRGSLGEVVSITAIRSGIFPPTEKRSHVGLDLAIHDVDICLFLLGQSPQKQVVYAQKVTRPETTDNVVVSLQFPSALATISTNWLSPIKIRRMTVTGTKGYAEIDYVKQTLQVYDRPRYPKKASYRELQQLVDVKPKKISITRQEPLRKELEFFLKNSTAPEKLAPFTTDALKAVEIVLQ